MSNKYIEEHIKNRQEALEKLKKTEAKLLDNPFERSKISYNQLTIVVKQLGKIQPMIRELHMEIEGVKNMNKEEREEHIKNRQEALKKLKEVETKFLNNPLEKNNISYGQLAIVVEQLEKIQPMIRELYAEIDKVGKLTPVFVNLND